MNDDYSTPKRSGAPLIQAALALLVASTLVTFSVLAFRTGFAEDRGRDVTAADIATDGGGAVVLPALGGSGTAADEATQADTIPETATAAVPGSGDEAVVLGTRVRKASSPRDRHRGRGLGHEKARGLGHHKDDGRDDHDGHRSASDEKAREEDDERDDHGDDSDGRDDDRDASRGSGSNSGGRDGSGTRGSGKSRASGGDREGSN